MQSLEPRTFLLVANLFGILCAFVLWVQARSFPDDIQGLRDWARAVVLIGCASGLASMRGILPDLFREGQGVVAEGKFDASGTLVAQDSAGATVSTVTLKPSSMMQLPVSFDEGTLRVAVSNPFDAAMLNAVQFDARTPVQFALAPLEQHG